MKKGRVLYLLTLSFFALFYTALCAFYQRWVSLIGKEKNEQRDENTLFHASSTQASHIGKFEKFCVFNRKTTPNIFTEKKKLKSQSSHRNNQHKKNIKTKITILRKQPVSVDPKKKKKNLSHKKHLKSIQPKKTHKNIWENIKFFWGRRTGLMEGKSRRRRTELGKKSCEKKKIEDNEVEPRVSCGRKF